MIWSVANKMHEKLDNSVFSNANIIAIFSNDTAFNTIDLNNINLDDDNFYKDDPETINHVRLITWHSTFEQ